MHTNFFRWTWTLGVRYSRTALSWTELDSQQTLDICLDRKVSSSFECCGGVCPLFELPVTKKFRQGENRTGSTEWVPDLVLPHLLCFYLCSQAFSHPKTSRGRGKRDRIYHCEQLCPQRGFQNFISSGTISPREIGWSHTSKSYAGHSGMESPQRIWIRWTTWSHYISKRGLSFGVDNRLSGRTVGWTRSEGWSVRNVFTEMMVWIEWWCW